MFISEGMLAGSELPALQENISIKINKAMFKGFVLTNW
tara:strand:+ start:27328 stop:27441 length:114 start_codon:yes stop_codon:yes gene_type:complete